MTTEEFRDCLVDYYQTEVFGEAFFEALLESSQATVTGEVKIMLRPGNAFVEGVTSPYSLMAATKGVYGEAAGEWTPQDALGYSRILSLTGMLQSRAKANGAVSDGESS